MKRKVIQLAGSTLVVSLPSAWAEKYKVRKGDDIEIIESNNVLKISKDSTASTDKKINLDLKDATRTTTRAILSALYKQGYDEITVSYNNKEVYDAILEKRKEVLLGFTIHEVSKNNLILGSFTHDSPGEFDKSLRRAFLVTMSMGDNLLNAIKNKNLKDLKDIKSNENVNNQLTSFCERILNKGFVTPDKTSFYYVVCWNLEKICDPYRDIITLIENEKQTNIKFSEDTIKLFEIVNNFLKRYYDAFYNYSLSKVVDLDSDKKAIVNMAKKAYANKNAFECGVINYLFEIAALTSNMAGPASAINIEKLTSQSS